MSSANEIQVGGKHYRSKYQHWDFAERNGLGYLESAATKYLTRHADKAGKLDLEKASHYTQKLMDLFKEGVRMPKTHVATAEIGKFTKANHVTGYDEAALAALCQWNCLADLQRAIDLIELSKNWSYPDVKQT